MVTDSTFTFRDSWVDLKAFEDAFRRDGPHETPNATIRFVFPAGCKIMLDAGLRLLSLANQLVSTTKRVILAFEEEEGTRGYLNRIGFLDHLDEAVEVIPSRPTFSGAEIYRRGASRAIRAVPDRVRLVARWLNLAGESADRTYRKATRGIHRRNGLLSHGVFR